MHKNILKFALVVDCRVTAAKIYLYYSTIIAKARPWYAELPEYTSVQINSSSPWSIVHVWNVFSTRCQENQSAMRNSKQFLVE